MKPESIDDYVGKKLRQRRKKIGATLSDLSKHLNVSHQQVQKYEQGETRISAGILYRISQMLGVKPDYFFEGYKAKGIDQEKIRKTDIIEFQPESPLNILLVEDDPSDEILLKKILEEYSPVPNVYSLRDGEQALSFLIGKNMVEHFPMPDIIFLDLNIPKVKGFDVLRALKRDADIRMIPVIVVSNSINKKEMLDVYKNYASGYVCKNFDLSIFKQQIFASLDYWSSTVVLPSRG